MLAGLPSNASMQAINPITEPAQIIPKRLAKKKVVAERFFLLCMPMVVPLWFSCCIVLHGFIVAKLKSNTATF